MIDSSATTKQVKAECDDTDEPWLSVEQCQRFLRACGILIRRLPSEAGSREGTAKYELAEYTKKGEAARQWLAANGGASAPAAQKVIVRPDFSNSRG